MIYKIDIREALKQGPLIREALTFAAVRVGSFALLQMDCGAATYNEEIRNRNQTGFRV